MRVAIKDWRRLLRSRSLPWALALFVLIPPVVAAFQLQALGKVPGSMMPQLATMLGGQSLSNVAAWQMLLLAAGLPWLSAGLLAGEFECETLEPYLAAGGRPTALLAGKLLAVLGVAGFFLLAGLPAYTLPALAGGVTIKLLGRALALLGATAVLMAAAGLAVAACSRRSGSAALAGMALGLALTLGTGMAAGVAEGSRAAAELRAMVGMGEPPNGTVPKWLYPNPLAGLASALDASAPALLGLPGAHTPSVYKQYSLWQAQLAGAGAGALLCLIAAWLALAVRLRWRRPIWLQRWRRRKVVAISG